MLSEDVKNKIECCFASNVYNTYLQTRYGILHCKTIDKNYVNQLNLLRKTFNYYFDALCLQNTNINPSATSITIGECSVTKLIEKINLL